jgi:hypothetical protein
MVLDGFLTAEDFQRFFNGTNASSFYEYICEDPAGKPWEDMEPKLPLCPRPFMPKGWFTSMPGDPIAAGLPGTDELCTEKYAVSMGSLHT